MKKLTLLLAVLMIAGTATFAQEKACCKKKGGKCAKETSCKKKCDKDADKKDDNKQAK